MLINALRPKINNLNARLGFGYAFFTNFDAIIENRPKTTPEITPIKMPNMACTNLG